MKGKKLFIGTELEEKVYFAFKKNEEIIPKTKPVKLDEISSNP